MNASGLFLAAAVVGATTVLAGRRVTPGQFTWWAVQVAIVGAFVAGRFA
jgi:hypothetical protein